MKRLLVFGLVALSVGEARAADFDAQGRWVADPEAVFVQSLESEDVAELD